MNLIQKLLLMHMTYATVMTLMLASLGYYLISMYMSDGEF